MATVRGIELKEASVATRNVVETNKQDATTTTKTLNLVLVEKNETFWWAERSRPRPPHVSIGTSRSDMNRSWYESAAPGRWNEDAVATHCVGTPQKRTRGAGRTPALPTFLSTLCLGQL